MTATYTFDVFSTVDGFGSYNSSGDWGGYWGKQGPEFLDRRLAQYSEEQRLVLGANTFRMFLRHLGPAPRSHRVSDPINHPDEEHADHGGLDARCTDPSTGRTRPSRAATPSASSPASSRSPRCRCARTAACR